MTGGKGPKTKGDEFEREVCKLFGGSRTFWQPGQKSQPDAIDVPYLGIGESKLREKGFTRLYTWLGENDFLAIRDDRRPMLVVMRAADLKLILEEMDELKKKALEGCTCQATQDL